MKHVIVDIEANNLLTPLLDYTSLPYKLKEEARVWCIILRDIDTDETHLLVNQKDLETKYPVKTITHSRDGVITSVDHYDEHNNIVFIDTRVRVEQDVDASDLALLTSTTSTNHEAIWYNNLVTKYELTKENLQKLLVNCEAIIGHNIINYDLPMLMLYGLLEYTIGFPGQSSTIFGKDCKVVDTLLWSKLLKPDRIDAFGKHSLAAWGGRCGSPKIDFHDFSKFSLDMAYYCMFDTIANAKALDMLMEERGDAIIWNRSYEVEAKTIDLALKQEVFGFAFDSELAHRCVSELDGILTERENIIIPKLPPKPMNKGEISNYTPPAKQLLKNGEPNSFITKFATKVGGEVVSTPSEVDPDSLVYTFKYKDKEFPIPFTDPVETEMLAQMKDNDHIKGYLLDLGWNPTEWSIRDVVRDSKKKMMDKEKVLETIERYCIQTFTGPYSVHRIKELGLPAKTTQESLKAFLLKSYEKSPKKPLRVPTSPKIKVGTDKEICPNLMRIKENNEFSTAFAEYSTYKHRKTSISGGDIDEETGEPSKGFLSYVRSDGRVATPVDTLGASTSRMLHRQIRIAV